MKLTLLILPALAAITLSSVHLLPSAGELAQSAVIMALPPTLEDWQLRPTPPTEAEIVALADDTEFSKAECYRPRKFEYTPDGKAIPDVINLSVVLSGTDINNSIHRPERCMPAQGHQILSSTDKDLSLNSGRNLEIKCLKSIQRFPQNEERTEFLEFKCLTYYFFIGHDRITNDHLTRTLVDMKDRLLYGRDQRWAYVSVSIWYGELPWMGSTVVSEEEATQKLSDFVIGFADEQIDWALID